MTEQTAPEAAPVAARPFLLANTITPKIVIFNGPPGSGKTTVTEAFIKAYSQAVHCQFAAPLKAAAACLLGISIEDLEAKKEEPIGLALTEFTHREFLIKLSEDFTKKHLGQAAFGKIAARGIANFVARAPSQWLYIFSDGGFKKEVEPLIEEFGAENILIIHLHRQDCNFKNDSRSYIKGCPGMGMRELKNDGSIEDLIQNAGKIIEDWVLSSLGKKAEEKAEEKAEDAPESTPS